MGESGWKLLLELCCQDVCHHPDIDLIQTDSTLMKHTLVEKMANCCKVYKEWDKSWALKQAERKCQIARREVNSDLFDNYERAFVKHMQPMLLPTIDDSILVFRRLNGNVERASDYMAHVSRLGEPAFTRLLDVHDGDMTYFNYKEPSFDPVGHREPILTHLVFHCICDIINSHGGGEIDSLSSETVLARFMFYEKIYHVFSAEFWPGYIHEEIKTQTTNYEHFNLFSQLLKLELDDITTCPANLVKLFECQV